MFIEIEIGLENWYVCNSKVCNCSISFINWLSGKFYWIPCGVWFWNEIAIRPSLEHAWRWRNQRWSEINCIAMVKLLLHSLHVVFFTTIIQVELGVLIYSKSHPRGGDTWHGNTLSSILSLVSSFFIGGILKEDGLETTTFAQLHLPTKSHRHFEV